MISRSRRIGEHAVVENFVVEFLERKFVAFLRLVIVRAA